MIYEFDKYACFLEQAKEKTGLPFIETYISCSYRCGLRLRKVVVSPENSIDFTKPLEFLVVIPVWEDGFANLCMKSHAFFLRGEQLPLETLSCTLLGCDEHEFVLHVKTNGQIPSRFERVSSSVGVGS